MQPLSDELLCAYLDGELSQDERAALELQLLGEPGARVRLDRFREADARLRQAFAHEESALDAALIARLREAPAPVETAPAATVVAFRRPDVRRFAGMAGFAMAATVVGIAIGLGWQSTMFGSRDDTGMTASLSSALDTLPSGGTANGTQLILSFRKQDGTPCRQFETLRDDRRVEGVACRSERTWKVVAWNELANDASDGFRTAGAGSSLENVIDDIDATGALSLAEEGRLIAKGW